MDTAAHLAVAVPLDFPLAEGVPGKPLLHALPLRAELAVAGPLLNAVGARDVLRQAAALRQPLAQRTLQPQLPVILVHIRQRSRACRHGKALV